MRLGRARKGKKLSNDELTSKTDPETRIARMKDGRTHLAYKPEHAVDLDTGVIVVVTPHPANRATERRLLGTMRARCPYLTLILSISIWRLPNWGRYRM